MMMLKDGTLLNKAKRSINILMLLFADITYQIFYLGV
jgi:hypothetical protein